MMICLKTGGKLSMENNDRTQRKILSTGKNEYLKKALNFDFDTQIMKQYNLSMDYVYSSIKKYMEKIILHIYNILGYESNKVMSPYEVTGILEQLKYSLP